MFADITVTIYERDSIKTAYLSNRKKRDLVSLYNYDFEFTIEDINQDSITISIDSDKYKLDNNIVFLKKEIKVSDNLTNIYIRLDNIK